MKASSALPACLAFWAYMMYDLSVKTDTRDKRPLQWGSRVFFFIAVHSARLQPRG
jgi:hypothetical protein